MQSAPPSADDAVISGIDDLKSRYRLVAKLGSGGMADVFLGVQLGEQDFKRLVVIKKIHARGLNIKNANALQMFVDEARTVAALNHPHIVKVYDLNRQKEDIFITMEYVDGETLSFIVKTLVKREKRTPLPIACRLITQACEALHYAHTATTPEGKPLGLVHRDIDTQNIMIDSNGYVKIIDFGVAKTTTQTELTTPGMFKGKISYVAPDVFKAKEIDHRVDVYALGLVFYAITTLRKPFPFKSDVTVAEVINRVLNDQLPKPSEIDSDLPTDLDDLIAKATHKDREQRFQTCEEFAEAVRKFADANGGIATTGKVKRWYQEEFTKRIDQRREFERKALKKAKALADKQEKEIDLADSKIDMRTASISSRTSSFGDIQPPPSMASMAPGSITGSHSTSGVTPSGNFHGHSTISSVAPQKKTNPYLLLLLIFGLFSAGAILVQQLFWNAGENELTLVTEDVDTDSSRGDNLFIESIPENAAVFINNKKVGTTGSRGLSLRVVTGKYHEIRISKDGYETYEIAVEGQESGTQEINAHLIAMPSQPPPEPEPSADEQEEEKIASATSSSYSRTSKRKWGGTRKSATSKSAIADGTREPEQSEPENATPTQPQDNRESEKDTVEATAPTPVSPRTTGGSESSTRNTTASTATSKPKTQPQTSSTSSTKPSTTTSTARTTRTTTTKPTTTASKTRKPERKKNHWYSGDGKWSGREAMMKGCMRCHNGRRASRIVASRRSKTEWRYFFVRHRHARYGRLDRYFSDKELKGVMGYLMSRAF